MSFEEKDIFKFCLVFCDKAWHQASCHARIGRDFVLGWLGEKKIRFQIANETILPMMYMINLCSVSGNII